jgi:hypothetical protein
MSATVKLDAQGFRIVGAGEEISRGVWHSRPAARLAADHLRDHGYIPDDLGPDRYAPPAEAAA